MCAFAHMRACAHVFVWCVSMYDMRVHVSVRVCLYRQRWCTATRCREESSKQQHFPPSSFPHPSSTVPCAGGGTADLPTGTLSRRHGSACLAVRRRRRLRRFGRQRRLQNAHAEGRQGRQVARAAGAAAVTYPRCSYPPPLPSSEMNSSTRVLLLVLLLVQPYTLPPSSLPLRFFLLWAAVMSMCLCLAPPRAPPCARARRCPPPPPWRWRCSGGPTRRPLKRSRRVVVWPRAT